MTTIFLVEDREPSRDALSRRLERRGNKVQTAAGADDFDSKPIRFEQLLEKIDLLARAARTP